MPSNFGESMRRNIEAEANQEDDGGFFARLGRLEPDTDNDDPPAKGLFQHMTPSNDDENRADCHTAWENRYNKIPGHTGHGLTTDEYLELEELEKRRQEDMKSVANYVRRRYGRKQRKPFIRIRRIWPQASFQTWHWQCALCDHHMNTRSIGSTHYGELCSTWAEAYRRADRHAHNHHKRWGQ